MSRPTEQISWATDVLLDPVTGNINRAAPSVQSTFSGLLRDESLDRQLYNYHIWLLSQYVNYFDAFDQVSNVIQTTDAAVTTTTLNTDLGGTWSSLGTQTVGTTDIYWFERIAN